MNGKFHQFVSAEPPCSTPEKSGILFFAGNFFNMMYTQNTLDNKKIDGNLESVDDQIAPGELVNNAKFKRYLTQSFKVVHNNIDHNGCEGFDGDKFPSFGFEHWACLRLMEYISNSYPKYKCYVQRMSWAQYFPQFERIRSQELVVSVENGMHNHNFNEQYSDPSDPPLVIVDAGSSKTRIQLNKSHPEYDDAKKYLTNSTNIKKIKALHTLSENENTRAFIDQCNDICDKFHASKILIATAGMRDFVNEGGVNEYTRSFCDEFGVDNVYIVPGQVEALFEHNACVKIIESETEMEAPQVIMCSMGGQSTQMSDGDNVASYDTMGAISMQKTCKCSEKRAFNDVLAPSLKDEVLKTLLAFKDAGFNINFEYIPNI